MQIPRNPRAPALARAALDSCHELCPARRATAELLVSELVTNSVKYGAEDSVRVEVSRHDDTLHVEVSDDGPGLVPKLRSKPATDVGGWGLHLVDCLADRWGVREGTARVWFELGVAT